MAVQYYFDALDPTTFQRLINSLLNAHFGEQLRLYPLRGKDGGQDAATPSPFRFEMDEQSMRHLLAGIRHEPGRYLFQVKHHRMSDHQAAAVRANVVADFVQELTANVLLREPHERVNQFFLVTNVPSSKEAITKIDEKRKELLAGFNEIHADVLWQEHVIAWLDQSPNIWHAFPELFAGMKVPTLGQVADPDSQGLPRSLRMALRTQYTRDSVVRFRQISLEHSLFRLFVDLDVQGPHWIWPEFDVPHRDGSGTGPYYFSERRGVSSISALLTESQKSGRIILEGGPGQGKSTVTQMVTQLYRAMFLGDVPEYRQASLSIPKARFPFRVELRLFAESLGARDRSIEEFIAETFSKEAGGARITVEDIHSLAERQPMIFIFDGLDEVGSDDLRDTVIQKILECIDRLQNEPDLRVVITSRPPAIAGRISKLAAFQRLQIMPLSEDQVRDYVQRWTEAICQDAFERERVVESFEKRKPEQHVRALVKNPMQLSVLLHNFRRRVWGCNA